MFHRRSTHYLKGGLGDVPPRLPVDGAARARDYLRAWQVQVQVQVQVQGIL